MSRPAQRRIRVTGRLHRLPVSALRGYTLLEMLVGCFVLVLMLFMALGFFSAAARSNDRNKTDMALADGGRRSVDEMLYQIRGASQIVPSRGTTVTDSASVVLRCPSFNTGDPTLLLGTDDYVTFRFDPDRHQITETIEKGTPSSQRPTRTQQVLVRDVAAVRFSYRAREKFGAPTAGMFSKKLSAPADGPPLAYVDGVATSCAYNPATNIVTVTIPVTSPQRTVDVQFAYTIPSQQAAGPYLVHVREVAVEVQLSRQGDAPGALANRANRLQGTACLRNRR
jgi:type II secretory pathway pseudopilin PulG